MPMTPGADAGQHGFGEAPAVVDGFVGLNQFVTLLLDATCHEIEGAGQGLKVGAVPR